MADLLDPPNVDLIVESRQDATLVTVLHRGLRSGAQAA